MTVALSSAERRQHFEKLICYLEQLARKYPRHYRLCVKLLVVLGYLYILGLLVFIGAILALVLFLLATQGLATMAIDTAWFLPGSLVIVIVLHACYMRTAPPAGLRINRARASGLIDLIDDIRHTVHAPPCHAIMLSEEFNVTVTQISRLGILGWPKNYLVIGLPLLMAVTTEQFRAIIAHELGHLSGQHAYICGLINKVKRSWMTTLETLTQPWLNAHPLFRQVIQQHFQFFNAAAIVISRMNELAADACAARITSPDHTAQALLATTLRGRQFNDQFWPNILQLAATTPITEVQPYSTMLQYFKLSPLTDMHLQQALQVRNNEQDTHPTLAERLQALAITKIGLPALGHSAAEELLTTGLADIVQEFDSHWQIRMSAFWQERYHYIQDTRQQLQSLEEKRKSCSIDMEEHWALASWNEEIGDISAALTHYQTLLQRDPTHAEAHFRIGRVLLQQNNPLGLEFLRTAMNHSCITILPACELAYGFLRQQGEDRGAEEFRRLAEQHYDILEKARLERMTCSAQDDFIAHQLSADELTTLCQQLSVIGMIDQAWLAAKFLYYLPEFPCLVLLIKSHERRFWQQGRARLTKNILKKINMPAECLLLIDHAETSGISSKIKDLPNSHIFCVRPHMVSIH